MTYAITFSHKVNGNRVPLVIDGVEFTMNVEANDRSGAINHPDVATFCEGRTDDTRPRRISP